MNLERSAVLLAFHEENEVLTKSLVIRRAIAASGFQKTSLELQFNNLIDMGAIGKREWISDRVERQVYLTPKGGDMWAQCNVGD